MKAIAAVNTMTSLVWVVDFKGLEDVPPGAKPYFVEGATLDHRHHYLFRSWGQSFNIFKDGDFFFQPRLETEDAPRWNDVWYQGDQMSRLNNGLKEYTE